MSGNQVRLLLSDEDEHTEWFRFRNVNKWIHKLWKPIFIGMYVGKYEGGWKDGKMHGKGTLSISRIFRRYMSLGLVAFGWRLIDQGKYVGEWKNGKEHGKGIRFYRAGLMNNDNGRYEGEWKDGKYHGKGTFTYRNGGEYEGEWKDGLEHGHGITTWSNGKKIFVGEWKNGKYYLGTYYFGNGDKHYGFFKDGIAKGYGTRTYSNGRKYTGEFKCREKHSEGTSVLNGKKTVCRFIESIPRGFDTNKNYVGIYYVHYKDENSSPVVSYLSLN